MNQESLSFSCFSLPLSFLSPSLPPSPLSLLFCFPLFPCLETVAEYFAHYTIQLMCSTSSFSILSSSPSPSPSCPLSLSLLPPLSLSLLPPLSLSLSPLSPPSPLSLFPLFPLSLPLSSLRQLFERLRSEQPGAVDKVVPVFGDIQKKQLGMRREDQEMLQDRVSIVFHLAATVRFESPLRYRSYLSHLCQFLKLAKYSVSFLFIALVCCSERR